MSLEPGVEDPIYLDYNATTPLLPEVREAMLPFYSTHFGNPSSTHPYGTRTRLAVEEARNAIACLLDCDRSELFFTSGGTEANNQVLKGVALHPDNRRRHIITSAIEHPAVLVVCDWLSSEGFEITRLPVDAFGRIDPAALEANISDRTLLVSIMHANNEIGTVQPIRELADIAHRHGALMHTDAAQSIGKIPVRVSELDVDLLTVVGHKLYGPKGIGAVFSRSHVRMIPLLHGAGHEQGRRPGTENVAQIVGLGTACALAHDRLQSNMNHLRTMRDRLYKGLMEKLGTDRIKRNGHPEFGLPNTLSISFLGIEANILLARIGDEVAASAGAACHADRIDISDVLRAIKLPMEWAMGTVRFSTGIPTRATDIDTAVDIISEAVHALQGAEVPDSEQDTTTSYKLTRFTKGLGCACKVPAPLLSRVLSGLPEINDPDVLADIGSSEDAAVYRLDDRTALVQTLDFITPVVDDPYIFGQIAAANALSDVYAMGAVPKFGLNIVGFPTRRLPLQILERILAGAVDRAQAAGIYLIGGHTIDDPEPKFGMAVTGTVGLDALVRNNTSRPGDAVILTKALGTGILTTALKRGLATPEQTEAVTASMIRLNRAASEVMCAVGVHACTDVTGFGLLGHLREAAHGSKVDVMLFAGNIPVLPGALEWASTDMVPGGTIQNLKHVLDHVGFRSGISESLRYVLADAQTSGGLLIFVSAERAPMLLEALHGAGEDQAVRIGTVTGPGTGRIEVDA